MTIKFKDIRNYIAKCSSPVSILIKETAAYENYIEIGLVPEKYDDMYLYGIGAYEDLFDLCGEMRTMSAVEIVVSQKPRFSE
ncbi:MAG: hypothetical protein E7478_01685 [Ruminococcaceae bacterium]|nr:hypothetical protein [Oscillospiraceae bacterium]